MLVPKLIALDSSTLGNLARDWRTHPEAKRVVDLLNSGRVVLFVTWHHLEELIQHESNEVYEERLQLLDSLGLVSYPKLPWDIGNVGSFVDLIEYEINAVLKNPSLSHDAIVAQVRQRATNGFAKGSQVCRENIEYWNWHRQNLASDSLRRKAEIASLTHFHVVDVNQKVSPPSKDHALPSLTEAKERFEWLGRTLASILKTRGDPRIKDADQLANELMAETYGDFAAAYQKTGSLLEAIRIAYGVDTARIPKDASIEDAGFEAIFVKQLRLQSKRLLVDFDTLYNQIGQEHLPSWIVWREVNRRTAQLPNAEAGNINDQHMVSFGNYVDHIQVDKRMAHFIQQGSLTHPLLKSISGKVFRSMTHDQLADFLEELT